MYGARERKEREREKDVGDTLIHACFVNGNW